MPPIELPQVYVWSLVFLSAARLVLAYVNVRTLRISNAHNGAILAVGIAVCAVRRWSISPSQSPVMGDGDGSRQRPGSPIDLRVSPPAMTRRDDVECVEHVQHFPFGEDHHIPGPDPIACCGSSPH